MRIGTKKGISYLCDLFDGFYLQREYNRDFNKIKEIKEFCDSLYQEGLLLKYSTTPYDNATAAMHAFDKYHLEYLTEPRFRTEIYWKGSEKLQVNYATLLPKFIDLIVIYKS